MKVILRPIFGFGVDEKAAIIYESGKLKIFSAGPRATGVGDATCHILFVNNLNEVMCIPITPNTGEALTMDEWIDRAMRSVMALQSPLDLVVGDSVSNACHRRGCSAAIDFMTLGEYPSSVKQSLRKEFPRLSPLKLVGRCFTDGARKPQDDTVHVHPFKEKFLSHEFIMTPPPPPPPPPPTHSPVLTPFFGRIRSQSVNSFVDMLQIMREIPG